MARHAPVVEHAGNTLTVIAPTAEEAMALIGDAGPGFRTTSVGKVRRGGLAGFFATEMVRVVAEGPDAGGSPVATGIAGPGATAPLRLATADDLLASLCGGDGPFAGRLAAGIQRSIHERPTPAIPPTIPPTPPLADRATPPPADRATPPPADRATPHPATDRATPPAAATPEGPLAAHVADAGLADRAEARVMALDSAATSDGAVGIVANVGVQDLCRSERAMAGLTAGSHQRRSWSAAALDAVGLPSVVVERVARVHPHDEVTWNVALMLALRDWCGTELPSGAVIAGPAGTALALALHVPVATATVLGDRDGAVAVPDASAADLAAAGARPIHLVVGGQWRHLATTGPAIVSAATPADLVEAVRVAVAWGASLGWTMRDQRIVRIDPFVVADQLRALLDPTATPPMSAPADHAPRRPVRSQPTPTAEATDATVGRSARGPRRTRPTPTGEGPEATTRPPSRARSTPTTEATEAAARRPSRARSTVTTEAML